MDLSVGLDIKIITNLSLVYHYLFKYFIFKVFHLKNFVVSELGASGSHM
jgi:hypothetical protein